MRLTGPCSTAEMLWEWALAEWDSSRVGRWYPDLPEARARLRSGAPYDHGDLFDQRIASTVADVRAALLKEVLPARVSWRRAALPFDELGDLRILNEREIRRLSPSPLLRDLAAALEADRAETRDVPLARAYRELDGSFDAALIRGAPILLAAREQGPFHIVEGHRRLASLHARHADGRLKRHEIPAGDEIAVILGIWPGLKSWSWYWDVADAPLSP